MLILNYCCVAEMSVVVCEDDKKANLLLDQSPRCLRKLITIKEVSPSTHQRAKSRGVEIIKFSDVEIQGAQKNHPCVVSVFEQYYGITDSSREEFQTTFCVAFEFNFHCLLSNIPRQKTF